MGCTRYTNQGPDDGRVATADIATAARGGGYVIQPYYSFSIALEHPCLGSFARSTAAGADGKADAGDLVSALLHPEGKCSESPLDSISINLAQ